MLTEPPQSRVPARRTVGWVALGLAILLFITGTGLYALYRHLAGNIHHSGAFGQELIPRPAQLGRSQNILLIGSDTRSFAGGNHFGGEVAGARSDTTILVHLSASGRKAIMVSIPRDSWVRIPACRLPDGQRSSPQVGKFNLAFALGGPACTIATVESLTGIRIDHFVVVNFQGFQRMVDALGGVTVCLTHPVIDPIRIVNGQYEGAGIDLPAGNDHLNGRTALGFVRARYGVGDGSDLGRIKNQQLFLSAVIRKASGLGLLHSFSLYRFLDAATKSIETDPGFGLLQLKHLADALHGLRPGRVQLLTVPVDFGLPGVPSADVGWDPVRAPALWDALRHDQPLPGSQPRPRQSPGPTLLVAPAHVPVRVLNATSTRHRAAQVAAQLRAAGFDVIGTGDATTTSAQTVVRYGRDREQSSQTLAAAVPGSLRQLDPTLSGTVELIVGSDYRGVVGVTVGTGASPTPQPTITAVTAASYVCSA